MSSPPKNLATFILHNPWSKEKKGRTILDKIYNAFKDKFISCKEDEDYFITDFKCGLNTDGSPLRWEYKDIMKGYKILDDGYKMKFQELPEV